MLTAVGYSTDRASTTLPGTSAPAKIGWSARLVWAAAGATQTRPRSSGSKAVHVRE